MTDHFEIDPPGVSDVTQTLMFREIWQRSSAKSFISGLWLRTYIGTDLWQNCFLRVLSERNYPYFRFYFRNIVLVTPGEKGLWEQGSEEERIQYSLGIEENSRGKSSAEWQKVKDLESYLKDEYKKAFPITKGGIVGYKYSLEEQKRILSVLNRKYLSEPRS